MRSTAGGRLALPGGGLRLKPGYAFLQLSVNHLPRHGLPGGKLRLALLKDFEPPRRRVIGYGFHASTMGRGWTDFQPGGPAISRRLDDAHHMAKLIPTAS